MKKFTIPGAETAETPKNPDQFAEKLRRLPHVPGEVRAKLGKEFVAKFMAIMTSDEAIETDVLRLSGELTREQVVQYDYATENFATCIRQLNDLAIILADSIRPNLTSLVQREIEGRNKEGVVFLFRCVNLLINSRFAGLEELKLRSTFLTNYFREVFRSVVGADLIYLAINPDTPINISNKIQELVDALDKETKEITGGPFEGLNLVNQQESVRETLADSDAQDQISSYASLLTANEEDSTYLQKEIEADLISVKEQALYKYVPETTIHTERPQIVIIKNFVSKNKEEVSAILPVVRINFDTTKDIKLPAIDKNKVGTSTMMVPNEKLVINCTFDPTTGDLYFPSGQIPIKRVMDEDQYKILQRLVLKSYKDFLDSKEPDIEDLFKAGQPAAEPNYIIETQTDEPAAKPPEIATNETMDEPVLDQAEFRPVETVPTESQVEVESSVPKHLRAQMMQKISGARSTDIINAFRELAGREVRVNGSHHIFRNSETGATYPIPVHAKGKIPLGIIMDGIKVLGYTLADMAKILGYETRGN